MHPADGSFFIADGHCDTVHLFAREDYQFGRRNTKGHLDLCRLREGGVKLQFFALFIEPEYKPYQALQRALQLAGHLLREINKHREEIVLVKTIKDLEECLQWPKIAALMALEGGEPLEGGTEIVEVFYRLGLRCVGLTWNQRNGLADGVGVGRAAGGLTKAGKILVRSLHRLGIVVDAAHLAPRSFYDLLETAEKPVFVSHANAKALCAHPRNLDDEQLRALREQGGVMGMSFYPGFIAQNNTATLEHLLDHFCHVAEVAGVEILALGSDFDGIETVLPELPDVTCLPVLVEGLQRRGFSPTEVQAILGGNVLKLVRSNLLQEEVL
ncbi:MAG TPA: membrane dipeptidase [Firmicutes bacterium]|nr:membrane dipeptidase [Bacillota bacterium]